MVRTFNPGISEAEAVRSMSLKTAWSIELVPGQPKLHRETLFQEKKFFICFMYVNTLSVFRHTRRRHQMWLLEFELRTFGRAVGALNH